MLIKVVIITTMLHLCSRSVVPLARSPLCCTRPQVFLGASRASAGDMVSIKCVRTGAALWLAASYRPNLYPAAKLHGYAPGVHQLRLFGCVAHAKTLLLPLAGFILLLSYKGVRPADSYPLTSQRCPDQSCPLRTVE